MHKGDHLPACAEPWLFIDESYAVLEQVLKQTVEVAHGKTHLLNTGSALVEKSTDRVSSPVGSRSSILATGAITSMLKTRRKIEFDALVRHGFIFSR